MPIAVLVAALVAVVVWGASPVATKFAVLGLPPLVVAMLRTVLGGLAALPFALAMRIGLPKDGRQRLALAVSSFCGFIGFPALYSIGLHHTSAIHASLILAVLPIFTGAIAKALERRQPGPAWWIGCAVAFAGEMLLVLTRSGVSAVEGNLVGDLIVLGSALLASCGYVAGARLKQLGYPSSGATFWGVVLASAVLLPVVPWHAAGIDWQAVPVSAWLGVAYLALAVTILGYVLWYWALGQGGIARIGLTQFLQPVSGVLLSWLLLGEPLSVILWVATALILAGVWTASRAG